MNTTYTIHDYATGSAIGEVEMTDAQYRTYDRECQQPEGLMTVADLYLIGGEIVWSDVPSRDCTIYIEVA